MDYREVSQELLLTPEMQAATEKTREQWQNITYNDVLESHANTPTVEPTENSSRLYIVDPEHEDVDDSRSAVLSLPYGQGWKPHHYIRARTLQQIAFPNNRVLVLPNNMVGQQNYDLSNLDEQEVRSMKHGSLEPIADRNMRALEIADRERPLGTIALTGFSMGANTSLAMALVGSDQLEIDKVNADEGPSKVDRGVPELARDFFASSGNLTKAIKGANIKALSSAMRFNRFAADVIRFGLTGVSTEGRLIASGMTDTVNCELLKLSGRSNGPDVKIGFIKGSKMVDVDSFEGIAAKFDLVEYSGEGFEEMHGSGDNVILHALMANAGLNSR